MTFEKQEQVNIIFKMYMFLYSIFDKTIDSTHSHLTIHI